MFQSEMENLELGLNLRSSDLLFPDDLLNIPLDDQTIGLSKGENIFAGEVFADDTDCKVEKEEEDEFQHDLLAQIIEEVKLPTDFKQEQQDVTFWPVTDDISFVDANTELNSNQGPVSPTSSDSSSDDTQTLIDEMEEFLVSHETVNNIKPAEPPKTILTQNMETEKAEAILDALISGNINMNDSGYSSEINNITEVQTNDGNNVIIVITNDDSEVPPFKVCPMSPAMSSVSSGIASVASPSPSFGDSSIESTSSNEMEVTSDSDWSPGECSAKTTKKQRKPREPKKRGPYKRTKAYNTKDKKERKMLQNVVAARRYRDKKKNEQVFVEEEVQVLEKKNNELKSNLREMEGELKTLKKLMIELGLVKFNGENKMVTF